MTFLRKFWFWLDHKLKNDVYELRGSEIVRGSGVRSEDRLLVTAIREWQIHPEMGFDVVSISLTDGREFQWFDKHNDLIAILRRVVPNRELESV